MNLTVLPGAVSHPDGVRTAVAIAKLPVQRAIWRRAARRVGIVG